MHSTKTAFIVPKSKAQKITGTTWVRVDHAALRHNILLCAQSFPAASILAMVKADAYGHGALAISRTLEKFDFAAAFGVAVVEEGIALREAGIAKSIVIHAGACWLSCMGDLVKFNLEPVVSSVDELLQLVSFLEERRITKPLSIHLAIDTGMAREGICIEYEDDMRMQEKRIDALLAPFLSLFSTKGCVQFKSVFTHFANADLVNNVKSSQQEIIFSAVLKYLKSQKSLPPIVHIHNSAALLEQKDSVKGSLSLRKNVFSAVSKETEFWTRPGILLYGVDPRNIKTDESALNLKQVMHWYAPIVGRKRIRKNKSVSYGGTFITKRETEIAVVRVGYADGYARSLGNRAKVLIKGLRAPVIGTVCMDMILVDVTDLVNGGTSVELQDPVTLLGCDEEYPDAFISLEEMAHWRQTLSYEVACGVSARVPRIAVYEE